MVKTLKPLRDGEIKRILELGTDEARAEAEKTDNLKIEDVITGVGYVAWRLKDGPELFEKYEEAERDLSPPPSPATSNRIWNEILNSKLGRAGNIDDIYYDFWAKETYVRPQQQAATTMETVNQDQAETNGMDTPDDGSDYEEPEVHEFENATQIIEIDSSESEREENDQTWRSFNTRTITIDDSNDEDEEPNKNEGPGEEIHYELDNTAVEESNNVDGHSDDEEVLHLPELSIQPTHQQSNRSSGQSRHNGVKKEKSGSPGTSHPGFKIEKKSESPYPGLIRRNPRRRSTNTRVKIERRSESTDPEPICTPSSRRDTSRLLVKREELHTPEPVRRGGRKRVIKVESDDSDLAWCLKECRKKEELNFPGPVGRSGIEGSRKRLSKTEQGGSDPQLVFRNTKRLIKIEPDEDLVFKIDSDDDEDIVEVKELLNKPRALRSKSTWSDAVHIFLL